MNPLPVVYNQSLRRLLNALLGSTTANRDEPYHERMVLDFPDEMNRQQAIEEFSRRPNFWREFYDNDPRNLSKGRESPPDGNFAKPQRSFRPTPLDDILGPFGP